MEKVIGKLYSTKEIDKLYGECKHSQVVKTSILVDAANKCDDHIHFNIHGGNFVISKSCKDLIEPSHFILFSNSVLKDFLKKAKNEYTELQIRNNNYTMVIMNGENALQAGKPCPPDCF